MLDNIHIHTTRILIPQQLTLNQQRYAPHERVHVTGASRIPSYIEKQLNAILEHKDNVLASTRYIQRYRRSGSTIFRRRTVRRKKKT